MKLKIISASLLFSIATSANAIIGQWQGQYWYADSGQPFGTNYSDGNCFLSDGTWYSTTVHGLKWHWYQKGDFLYINAVRPITGTVFAAN